MKNVGAVASLADGLDVIEGKPGLQQIFDLELEHLALELLTSDIGSTLKGVDLRL